MASISPQLASGWLSYHPSSSSYISAALARKLSRRAFRDLFPGILLFLFLFPISRSFYSSIALCLFPAKLLSFSTYFLALHPGPIPRRARPRGKHATRSYVKKRWPWESNTRKSVGIPARSWPSGYCGIRKSYSPLC